MWQLPGIHVHDLLNKAVLNMKQLKMNCRDLNVPRFPSPPAFLCYWRQTGKHVGKTILNHSALCMHDIFIQSSILGVQDNIHCSLSPPNLPLSSQLSYELIYTESDQSNVTKWKEWGFEHRSPQHLNLTLNFTLSFPCVFLLFLLCYSGSSVPDPDGVTNTSSGGPCPPGHFCPAGTNIPLPCPAGTFSDRYGTNL